MLSRNLLRWLYVLSLFPLNVVAFEIDSFYQRSKEIKDASTVLNHEINTRLANAIGLTSSCNYRELYINVHNQISADSSAFGVIGGLESWSEKSPNIEKINPPPPAESIYQGTAFESVFSMGFWLELYGVADKATKKNTSKFNWAVTRWIRGTSDPLKLCKIPPEQISFAMQMVNSSKGFRGGPAGRSKPILTRRKGPSKKEKKAMIDFLNSGATSCLRAVMEIEPPMMASNLQAVVNINGQRIGCDKLGHFFSEGQAQFEKEYELTKKGPVLRKGGLKENLKAGKNSEEGDFGLWSTGIKSYGDLAANFGGSQFWAELGGGERPYVKCNNGRFEKIRNFEIGEYVTPAWDEGINCSEYSTEEMTAIVANKLKKLQLTCPVDSTKCLSIKSAYSQEVLESIVSPACKKLMGTDAGASTQQGVQ